MAAINVYLAVDGGLVEAEQGEQSEMIVMGDRPPEIGEEVDMGLGLSSLKKWQVNSIETYRSDEQAQAVYIAGVSPIGNDGEPDKSEWEGQEVTMNISLARAAEAAERPQVITYGWNFNGKIPVPASGRIYGYKPTEGTIEVIPMEWEIFEVETCKPEGSGLYKAVHLCWCRLLPI